MDDTWRGDSFKALAEVHERLCRGDHADLFADYIVYLDLRRRGLRKPAMEAAVRFAEAFASDPFEIRQRVCIHLVEVSERFWSNWPTLENWLVPGNLSQRLMVPTWREWRERAPTDARAWIYNFGHRAGLQPGHDIAFLTAPNDPVCQYASIKAHEGFLDYALHEFSGLGYILSSANDFRETVLSLKAVAHAMGGNLNPVVISHLEWLDQLASALATAGDERGKLPGILLERGIPRVLETSPRSPRDWFATLPDFLRK